MPKRTPSKLHHRCRPTAKHHPELRLLCSDLIKVRWVDGRNHRHEEIVVLEGFSLTGASLFTGVPLPAGALVVLHGDEEEFSATVRYCVPAPNGYLAAVSFGEKPCSYTPAHQMDLSRLTFSEDV